MSGFLPESEEQLYRLRPGANQDNVFPRTALTAAEKVVYETRPTLAGLSPGLFWGGGAILVFFLLILATAIGEGSLSGAVAVGVFTLLFGIPFFYAVYAWRTTSYALTDVRVVVRSGSDYSSAPLDQIQGVTLKPGSAHVLFALTMPPQVQSSSLLRSRRSPQIEWKATPFASAVVPFAQSAVAFFGARDRERKLRQQVAVASLQNKVICEYCGTAIDVTTLSPTNPRCPSCSAPLSLGTAGLLGPPAPST